MNKRYMMCYFKSFGLITIFLLPLVLLLLLFPTSVHATTNPSLGTAGSFAVLGGSTITNTGLTTVKGDMGVNSGTAVTGFPPGTISGTIHEDDAGALQAQEDASTAYTNIVGQSCTGNLTGQDLGGKTLTPGVYCFESSAQLTGTLILDGQGNSNSVFIFQVGSTLNTASSASVVLINGAKAYNSFWQVGSSATLGTDTSFAGNVLAYTSITATTGTASNGGLYALNGVVTLDTNALAIASGLFAVTVNSVSFTPITLNGLDQTMTGQLTVTVVDQTETDAGWHLMVTSTQFQTAGGKTLPATATSITGVDSTCTFQSSCTNATNSLSYPVTLPAGATPPAPITYFTAAANTGEGDLTVTATLSLKVPATTHNGMYSAPINVSLVSGP
jgi:Ice-binding-like/WxL domain surface cell wall-binding